MPRQLRNLLKQSRNLEEKLFYQPEDPLWRENQITSQELSDALTHLATRIIEQKEPQFSVIEMINQRPQLKGRPLAAFEKNALQVVEVLFNAIRLQEPFSERFISALNGLQLAFTRLSLNDLSFLDNSRHIAIRFLESLLQLHRHFDPNAGKLADYFSHAIELLVDRITNREVVNNQTFMMAEKKLNDYLNSFEEKAKEKNTSILAEIDKKSRHMQADQYTEQLISSKTQGEEMPIFLLDFFENHLKSNLHEIIGQSGVNSKACQQLLTDMDTLIWSITCPFGDEGYNDRYDADVGCAMKRLFQLFESQNNLSAYVKEFFIEAESYHNQKLQGQRVQYDVMISANIFADEHYENNDKNDWSEKYDHNAFNIDSLQQSHWYFLRNQQHLHFCQLLSLSRLTRQIIFTNLSGELVANISFDESDNLNDYLTSFDEQSKQYYKRAFKDLSLELKKHYDRLKTQYQRFIDERTREQRQLQLAEEIQRKKEIQRLLHEQHEQRKQAQQQEERRLIAEQQKAERLAEEEHLEELDARERFHIKGIYRKLKPSVVIAYKNEQERWQEISLSLISKTTQKYIFVDSQGRKVIDPDKPTLLSLIGERRIKVVKESENRSDPLSSLVKQRRDRLSRG